MKNAWVIGVVAIVLIIGYGRYQNDPDMFSQFTGTSTDSTLVEEEPRKPAKKPSKKKKRPAGPRSTKKTAYADTKYPDITKMILHAMHVRAIQDVRKKGYDPEDMGDSFHDVYDIAKTDSTVIIFIESWLDRQIEVGMREINYHHLKDSIFIQ
jgi:hypothetical protein